MGSSKVILDKNLSLILLLSAVIDSTPQVLKIYNLSLVSAESHFTKFF